MTTRKQLHTELLALPDGQRERIIAQYAAMMQNVRSLQQMLKPHAKSETYLPAITAEMERLDVAAQRLEMMTMGMLSIETQRGAA
jgi:hypothetical protein